MIHLTRKGHATGLPLCLCNKKVVNNKGDQFEQLHYGTDRLNQLLAENELCPECKAMFLKQEDETKRLNSKDETWIAQAEEGITSGFIGTEKTAQLLKAYLIKK